MAKLAINGGVPVRSEPFPAWPPDDPGYLEALKAVLDSKVWGVLGQQGEAFCREFARFCEAEFAVACTSGTVALQLALRAAGIGAGDEVIIPPYTFIGSATACIAAGAVPVFADIEPDSFNLDPAAAEAMITPRTSAIMGVHIGGMPFNVDAVKAVAEKHGLVLIEDCAQAHGAEYRGKKVGALGIAGGFSFQSSKNLCSGEGGAIVTNDRELYERAWSLHNCGRVMEGGWYDHRMLGFNWRMTEFQAAILRHGLRKLPEQMALRDDNAIYLREQLSQVAGVYPQAFSEGATRSAWHLLICRYDREAFAGLSREKVVAALAAEGIPASAGYNPLYREPAFAEGIDYSEFPWAPQIYKGNVRYEEAAQNCPVCEELCSCSFWLYQSVLLGSKKDMDDIVEAIAKVQAHAAEVP